MKIHDIARGRTAPCKREQQEKSGEEPRVGRENPDRMELTEAGNCDHSSLYRFQGSRAHLDNCTEQGRYEASSKAAEVPEEAETWNSERKQELSSWRHGGSEEKSEGFYRLLTDRLS